MSEALGNSKTTMSNSVRSLLAANLIRRVWRKGERKNLYVANSSLFKSFMQTYKNKWSESIEHQTEALQLLKQEMRANSKTANNLEDRLDEMITFHELLQQVFNDINPNTK